MFIPNEPHYRQLLLPEHWDLFVARLPKLEASNSTPEQSLLSMKADSIAQQIMDENPDDYMDDDEYDDEN